MSRSNRFGGDEEGRRKAGDPEDEKAQRRFFRFEYKNDDLVQIFCILYNAGKRTVQCDDEWMNECR